MKKQITLKDKFKYFFDNTLAAGTISIIIWLAVLSVLAVTISALLIVIFGIQPEEADSFNFFEAWWQSLMRSMDAGTVAGDMGWKFRALAFIVTLFGIFILSALIGALTSGLEDKLTELRKGRSKVIEENHTLILGWSPKITTIISEIIIANENLKKGRIVILAEKDKVEMDDEINDKIEDKKNTKIICRNGSPLDIDDLNIVNVHNAKSIIVLTDDKKGDIGVIKTVLAITNNPERKKEKYHIVAEIKHEKNLEAAYLVGGEEASFVYTADLIARVTAQTSRQSGLSIIYTELLDFQGDEIYFKKENSLIGKTYKDAINSYEKSAVIGIMHKGKVIINPAMNTIIDEFTELITIAEDDDKVILSNTTDLKIDSSTFSENQKTENSVEKNLILGWNNKGSAIIRELEEYVKPDSIVMIVQDVYDIDSELEKLKIIVRNQKINYLRRDITEKSTYEEFNITDFDNVILLGYSKLDIQEADAKTLIALLHIRNISEKTGKHISIVSEMFDLKNRKLAEVTKADDFIISENMISLMISQLSENKNLKKVFDELFKADGSEIYLKPATDYIKAGSKVNFYTIIEAASIYNETAIGYKLDKYSHNSELAYGVFLNPLKSDEIEITEKDKVIVLAED